MRASPPPAEPLLRARRRGLYIFVAWTAIGLFFFSQDVWRNLFFQNPTPPWKFLVSWMIGCWIAALATPIILAAGERYPIERRTWARNGAIHVGLALIVGAAQLVVNAALLTALGPLGPFTDMSFRDALVLLAVLSFHGNLVSYGIVLGIQHAARTYRRYQERELHAAELKTQLARAQLGALKVQLQPHFLFNTLNAIMVLVRQERGAHAEEMLARLSDLLRCVLDDVEAQEVPLRRELEYVRLYLSIEELRFQDRLRVEISAPAAVLEAAVPNMSLQPLVENAVRHGIGKSAAAGRIEIRAARVDGALEVRVVDDGPGLGGAPAAGGEGRGIGLANTRARLAQLYGAAAGLSLTNGDHGGAVATMTVPYRVAEPLSRPNLEPEPTDGHLHAHRR
jgi:two-component system, LytTR family, sensor kinase